MKPLPELVPGKRRNVVPVRCARGRSAPVRDQVTVMTIGAVVCEPLLSASVTVARQGRYRGVVLLRRVRRGGKGAVAEGPEVSGDRAVGIGWSWRRIRSCGRRAGRGGDGRGLPVPLPSATVTVNVSVSVAPLSSVTVSVTVWVPAKE